MTGGNGHLGSSFVRTLRSLNANVLIVDKQETVRDDIARDPASLETEMVYYKCDLEIEEERTSLATFISSSFGQVDGLVNNAAFVGDSSLSGWSVPFEEQSLNSWRKALEVNVTAEPFSSMPVTSSAIVKIGSWNNCKYYVNLRAVWSRCEYLSGYPDEQSSSIWCKQSLRLEQLTRSLATVPSSPLIRVNAISSRWYLSKPR